MKSDSRSKVVRLAGCMAAAMVLSGSAWADVLYVDKEAPTGGDGESWATAHASLRGALEHARLDPAVDRIWVAAGTYFPGSAREHSFALVDGVFLLGGFPPESHLSAPGADERDPTKHATVLSGDIDHDGTHFGNSYHVVTADQVNGKLDGFRVSGGYANGGGSYENTGGALYAYNCTLELRDCRFLGCRAEYGGALSLRGGDTVIESCRFLGNEASEGNGGAINAGLLDEPDSLCIRRSRFLNGAAAGFGGAIYSTKRTELLSCVFDGNMAAEHGGALSLEWNTGTILHGTFTANYAELGGGAIACLQSTLTIDRSILWKDSAGSSQPEIELNASTVTVRNSCVENLAFISGADASCFEEDPLFLDADGLDDVAGTADDELRLRCDSPCLDAGTSSLFTNCMENELVDLLGETRSNPDIGAYEHLERGTLIGQGDGSGAALPCDNYSAAGAGEGALNSTGRGAALCATGGTEVASDDLYFQGEGLVPGAPSLLLAGSSTVGGGNGLPLGDGLRCVGGSVRRLGFRMTDADGTALWGAGLGSVLGVSSGDRHHFQVWYRDPSGSCGSGFNFSSGRTIEFL